MSIIITKRYLHWQKRNFFFKKTHALLKEGSTIKKIILLVFIWLSASGFSNFNKTIWHQLIQRPYSCTSVINGKKDPLFSYLCRP
jgi:ATP sulfurylase